MSAVELRVRLIGSSRFVAPEDVPFGSEVDGGQALTEFAGRAVYESWARTVPATATNAGFLAHILQVGHLSVLEHATVTCYVTGLSRAAAHELIRHRHFSVSQLSPRTPAGDWVAPAGLDRRPAGACSTRRPARRSGRTPSLLARPRVGGRCGTRIRRSAASRPGRQASGLLPVRVRDRARGDRQLPGLAALHRDPGDRRRRRRAARLAVAVLRLLQSEAPHVFADFRISTLSDGTETAASPLVGRGLTEKFSPSATGCPTPWSPDLRPRPCRRPGNS